MLKTIALAGLFVFTSAVSTAATTSNVQRKENSTQSVPKAPQPQGLCLPRGTPC